jgi:6,7-dimethyl-8-ribityllumazine synthase
MELAAGRRLAIGNGILTVEDEAQAWARARVSEGDKGGAAARACLEVLSIKRRLLGQAR